MGKDDVAAGDGALQTCNDLLVSSTKKSCINTPALDTACALIPGLYGFKSESFKDGQYF